MFLVGRDGMACSRYANTKTPSSIKDDILTQLDACSDGPSPVLVSEVDEPAVDAPATS